MSSWWQRWGSWAPQNAEKLETAQIDEVQSIEVASWKHFYEHVFLGLLQSIHV